MNSHEEVLSWWGDTAGSEGAQITVGPDGRLTGLLLGDSEQLVGALGVRGIADEPYRPDEIRVDADEIETAGRCAGLDVRVRHSFDHVWQMRIGLTNPGDRPVRVGRLLLDAAAGADGLLEVFGAGAVAYLTYHRLTSPRCLSLRLTRGDLFAGRDGLGTPELELAPGGRYQVVLSGEWYAGPDRVRQRLPIWFPDSLDHPFADRADPLIEHPDVAVTVRAVTGAPDLDVLEIAEPRGVARLEVSYVDIHRACGRIARDLVDRGELTTAAEALIVLRGVADHTVGQDEAAGLVEAYLDRPGDAPGPLRVVLLLRARDLLGEHLAVRAAAELAALPPGPGVLLAGLHLFTAAPDAVDGLTPESLAGRLVGLLADPDTDPVTLTELQLLLAGGSEEVGVRLVRARREVDLLCATDPGELWPLRSDADAARALAVDALLPNPQGEPTVAYRRVRRLIARSPLEPDGLEAVAWLLTLPSTD